VVRAALRILDAAWHSDKPGSLHSDLDQLSQSACLSVEKLRANWNILFDGWVLQDDGRLCHPRLSEIWSHMSQTYGDALRQMELAALVMQADASRSSPEGFELLSPSQEAAASRSANKGKKILPVDFQPNEASVAAMERSGYVTVQERQWLLQRFGDFVKAQRRMYVDWQAAFRNFLANSMTKRDFRGQFGYLPGVRTAQQTAGVTAAASGGALARLRNRTASDQTDAHQSHHSAPPPLADTFAQRQLGNARTMFTAAAAKRGLFPLESHFGDVPDGPVAR